jgi:hypothetical protein
LLEELIAPLDRGSPRVFWFIAATARSRLRLRKSSLSELPRASSPRCDSKKDLQENAQTTDLSHRQCGVPGQDVAGSKIRHKIIRLSVELIEFLRCPNFGRKGKLLVPI